MDKKWERKCANGVARAKLRLTAWVRILLNFSTKRRLCTGVEDTYESEENRRCD